MGYVDTTLMPGETVIRMARFHWTYTAGAITVLILGSVAGLAVGQGLAGWLVFAFFALLFLRMMIVKWSTEIAVTSRRFLYKQGWISRKTQELPRNRIEETSLRQSILDRIWGTGRLTISGTGGDKPIKLPTIDDPIAFRRALLDENLRNGEQIQREPK